MDKASLKVRRSANEGGSFGCRQDAPVGGISQRDRCVPADRRRARLEGGHRCGRDQRWRWQGPRLSEHRRWLELYEGEPALRAVASAAGLVKVGSSYKYAEAWDESISQPGRAGASGSVGSDRELTRRGKRRIAVSGHLSRVGTRERWETRVHRPRPARGVPCDLVECRPAGVARRSDGGGHHVRCPRVRSSHRCPSPRATSASILKVTDLAWMGDDQAVTIDHLDGGVRLVTMRWSGDARRDLGRAMAMVMGPASRR